MKTIIYVTLLLCSLGLFGCSQESELHGAMEDMGGAMKAMKKSEEAVRLKAELAAFSAGLNIAKQQKVKPEDQTSFDEGMKKLVAKVGEATAALDAGNAELAKSVVKDMRELQETYHEKLGVEE